MADPKDKTVIPKGDYCYRDDKVCPYWSRVKGKPEQMDGYCSFIEKGDWELGMVDPNMKAEDVIIVDKTTGQERHPTPEELKALPQIGGLIWDQVKECGINEETYDESSVS